MRILLISFYFPPYNNIGSVRVGKLAKYFTRLGHEVRVVAAQDSLFPQALALEVPEERVSYTPWINVRRPAEIVAGRGEAGGAPTANAFAPPKHRLVSWIWNLYRSVLYTPDMQIGWYPYARRAAARIAAEWKPDLIYASAVPYTSLLVAAGISRKFKIPWFAELRDLWVDNHFYTYGRIRRSLETRLERRILNSAAGLITVSEPLAATLREKFKPPALVATNGFDPSDFPEAAPPRGNKFRIVYTGGLNRCSYDPSPLFEALALLGHLSVRFEVVFYAPPVDLGLARDHAAIHKMEHTLVLNSPVPYRGALQAQCEADALLFLIWNDEKNGTGVFSGKFFEYIGARRPILAIGQANNVAASVIRERSFGLVSQNVAEIATRLRTWLEQKDRDGYVPALPSSGSASFTREFQTGVIADFLKTRLQALQVGPDK